MIIADAIFNSKIRYGCAIHFNPVFDEEELEMKKNYLLQRLPCQQFYPQVLHQPWQWMLCFRPGSSMTLLMSY